ncbi:MAG: hypothetical protein ACLT3Y_06980 [Ruminococcus callidus]
MASLSEQTVQLRQKRESLQVTSEQAEQEWERLKQQAARRGQEYEQANQVLQNLLVRQSELRVLQQTAAGQQEELKAQLAEQGMRQSALRQACTEQNAAYDAAREQAQQAQEQFHRCRTSGTIFRNATLMQCRHWKPARSNRNRRHSPCGKNGSVKDCYRIWNETWRALAAASRQSCGQTAAGPAAYSAQWHS